jgi:hypothetical protein
MIKAECHSDDRKIEVYFDAEPFIIQATNEQLKALIACGLGGDYPADRIAEFMKDLDKDVNRMFDYCCLVDEGFECHIEDKNAFWDWIFKNKPALRDGHSSLKSIMYNMDGVEAKEKLERLLSVLILDNEKDASFLSKSKHIDDDLIEDLKEIAVSCIPDNLILE